MFSYYASTIFNFLCIYAVFSTFTHHISWSDSISATFLGKFTNKEAIKNSIAYQALTRIAAIFKLENTLKDLSEEQRLIERQNSIKPLVEEYLSWVRERLADTSVLPKGKTAEGLNYSVNQEKYLKVFLENGNVPIDNSACLSEGITYPHLFPESRIGNSSFGKRCV